MTDQTPNQVSSEVKPKVAPEVQVKNPALEECENPEDPASEGSEAPRTGSAPAD